MNATKLQPSRRFQHASRPAHAVRGTNERPAAIAATAVSGRRRDRRTPAAARGHRRSAASEVARESGTGPWAAALARGSGRERRQESGRLGSPAPAAPTRRSSTSSANSRMARGAPYSPPRLSVAMRGAIRDSPARNPLAMPGWCSMGYHWDARAVRASRVLLGLLLLHQAVYFTVHRDAWQLRTRRGAVLHVHASHDPNPWLISPHALLPLLTLLRRAARSRSSSDIGRGSPRSSAAGSSPGSRSAPPR